jgi:Na+/H+ ion antiporter subunit.
MPFQILINLFVAFLWMFLQDDWAFLSFISGYIVGLFVLIILRRFFKKPLYVFFLFAILKLLTVFMHELIVSSIFVVKKVLRRKMDITPGIFKLETELDDEFEVALLAMLITLTPGSVVMEVSHDLKSLYVHGMDLPESKESVEKSQRLFEKAIKDVTRKYV